MTCLNEAHGRPGALQQTAARAPTSRVLSALGLAVVAVCAALPAWAQGTASAGSSEDDQYRAGLYLRETGRPYAAIETLETLLAANPTLNRARLELAVAYYRTLDFTKARAQAQRVLDDPTTPEAVRLSVLSFVKQIELEEAEAFGKPHRFEMQLSMSLLHDSNVNAGPDSAVLPGDLVLDPSSQRREDWGGVLQAGVTHTWSNGRPLRVGESTARLSWTSQASIYQKSYETHNDYNLTVATLATGPGVQFQSGDRTNLNVQFDALRLGSEYLATYVSLSPSYTLRLGNGELSFDGQWVDRHFKRDSDTGRSGQYSQLGLSYGRLYYGGRLAAQAGFSVFHESDRDDQFSNTGRELFAGARVRAWNNGDVFGRMAWRRANFEDPPALYDVARIETEKRAEVGVSHRFSAGYLDKWQLSGTLSYVDNNANLSLYDYVRTITTVTLGRVF